MLGALKRRWRTTRRPTLDLQNDDTDKEPQDMVPPRFIEVQKGRISLVQPKQCDSVKDKEVLEARIEELEDALIRLQERVNQSQCGSPTLERDLREQLESMNRALKSKDRVAMQACREHNTLQMLLMKQESCIQLLQNENKTLHLRVRQYEHCLDDVMRKVVDAIVAEDSLRDEVTLLKTRVKDLEAQNAALTISPGIKGKDEGYCTMGSGQQPPNNNHLEDLPEEPEQWLISAEPTAEMEDWSMSQEELETALEDNNDWIWNSAQYLNSTPDNTHSEDIAALLQNQIIYSDDEEICCKDFTRDFYRLVNIKSDNQTEQQSDSENEEQTEYLSSPTPSESGRAALISSCSSSDSDGFCGINGVGIGVGDNNIQIINNGTSSLLEDVLNACHNTSITNTNNINDIDCYNTKMKTSKSSTTIIKSLPPPQSAWRRSTGWKRVSSLNNEITNSQHQHSSTATITTSTPTQTPVLARRSFAS